MSLLSLQNKRTKRISAKEAALKGRRHQLALFKKTGKKGHKKQASKLGKQARKHQKAIVKLDKLIEKQKKKAPASGTGAWGGSKSIVVNEVMPVAREWGIPTTSGKRWATFGNPGSDHYMGNRTSFAKDFGTASNYSFGIAIGKALGIPYSGAADDYKSYYITRAGKSFRVQLICGTHGTGPHTHVGIRKV